MKQIQLRRPARFAPRNPLVALSHRRAAGPHGGSVKRQRQWARRELRSTLREMNEGP